MTDDGLLARKRIAGFEVEIGTDDGESTWVHVHDNERDLHASLELLRDFGGFETEDGLLVPMSDNVFDLIEDWAMSTGYY